MDNLNTTLTFARFAFWAIIGFAVSEMVRTGQLWLALAYVVAVVFYCLIPYLRRSKKPQREPGEHVHVWAVFSERETVWIPNIPPRFLMPVCLIRYCNECGRMEASPLPRQIWWRVVGVQAERLEFHLDNCVVRVQPGTPIVQLTGEQMKDFLKSANIISIQ